MKLAALLIFASLFTAAYSSILSPLFNEDGSSVMYPEDVVLDRNLIDMNLSSEHLVNSPESYKEFLKWFFEQPLFMVDDFDMMIEMEMVPLDIAHFAFSRFLRVPIDDPSFDVISGALKNALKNFIHSFDGFHEEFIEICGKLTEQNHLDSNYATAIFEIVEELQGDFKTIIQNHKIMGFILETGFNPEQPYLFCYRSMMESDWFTSAELATALNSFEFPVDPSLIELAKPLFDKPLSVVEFLYYLEFVRSDINELIRFIVSLPWITSGDIRKIIKKCVFDDVETLELELLMHEKATFESVTRVKFQKFQNNHPLIPQVMNRILSLIKPVAYKKELFKFLASIPLTFDANNNWTQSLVRVVFMAFPNCFYPAGDFFPEFIHVYDQLETSDFRQPFLALIYLDVFGHLLNKINEDDFDHFLNFAFASRPLELSITEIPIWTRIAEKIMTLSIKRGQELIQMAKRCDRTVFSEVVEVTDLISSMAAQCMIKSINELRVAHYHADEFMAKIPSLGKHEKAFLMLTAPKISKLYFYAFKSLNPDCVFYESARELSIVYQEHIKEMSLNVCKYYTFICGSKRTKTLEEDLQKLPDLMKMFKYCFDCPEHAGDLWMLREMAEMILSYRHIKLLSLTPDDLEFLRMILATKPTKTKRILEADTDEEPPTKKPRHF